MKPRSFVLGALLIAFGAFSLLSPKSVTHNVTEKDLIDSYPTKVGSYVSVPGADGSAESYRMDPATYDALKPIGIVTRYFDDGKRKYDVVVIAGDHADTFHDPLACFHSQDWVINSDQLLSLPVKGRGNVPVMLVHASKSGNEYAALYCYEGPTGMYATNNGLHQDLFLTQLKQAKVQIGTFFRFMTMEANIPDTELESFASEYLASCPVEPLLHKT